MNVFLTIDHLIPSTTEWTKRGFAKPSKSILFGVFVDLTPFCRPFNFNFTLMCLHGFESGYQLIDQPFTSPYVVRIQAL